MGVLSTVGGMEGEGLQSTRAERVYFGEEESEEQSPAAEVRLGYLGRK